MAFTHPPLTLARPPLAEIGLWGELGDWRDTFPALNAEVHVRYALDRFGGMMMIHCHYLVHEDLGMMDRFWVDSTGSATGVCTADCQNCSEAVRYCDDNMKRSFVGPTGPWYDRYPKIEQKCDGYRQTPVDTTPTGKYNPPPEGFFAHYARPMEEAYDNVRYTVRRTVGDAMQHATSTAAAFVSLAATLGAML